MRVLAAVTCGLAAYLGRGRASAVRLARPRPARREADWLTPRGAVLCLGAGAAALFAMAGVLMAVATGVVVVLALVMRQTRNRRSMAAAVDIGLCLDLLAAAMACGAMPAAALSAVARVVPAPTDAALTGAAEALAQGVEPEQVWSAVAAAVPGLQRAARACARASRSGAGVSQELQRLAAAARSERLAEQQRRLQRAGVWLVLPLGVCFLPAFVLVGIVPVVLAAVPGTVH